ncbi:MAG: biotin transporter BioY [Hyphomicrobiales bacterium]|nr:biotin transporter BioY [Hyphomicrobiales bacterium]PCJ96197.1 MAG: biotin transporter BioY [Hyphomicrobiales bacterium]
MVAQTLKQPNPLASALWTAGTPSQTQSLIRFVALAVLGAALLAISAKVRVPFWPVPMTLQTFAIMGLGAAYGMRLGLTTVLLYLAIGALGFDVFTGSSAEKFGLQYMMGGTGGYLLGFVIAMGFVGYFAERGWDRSPLRLFGLMLAADVIIFTLGLLWLGYLMGWDKPILEWGLYPFVAGDLVKMALASALIPATWHFLKKR